MESFELPEPPKIRQEKPQDRRAYTIVPIRACNDRRIRPAAMRVLLAVCSFANRAGLCWPSHANVGKMLGVSRQAAGRQIRILRDYGYLKVIKNHTYGKTAQILRVVYDEALSNSNLMESVKFEDLPTTLQAWQVKQTEELLNQNKETVNSVAVTAREAVQEELRVDELLSLWSKACSRAGIVRIVTTEDRQAAVSMCTAGASKGSFEHLLASVMADWQQYRRDPPHRLAWFASRLKPASEGTPSPPHPSPVSVGA